MAFEFQHDLLLGDDHAGYSHVDVIQAGNFNCWPKSTSSCQSVTVVLRSDFVVGCSLDKEPDALDVCYQNVGPGDL